MTKFLLCCGVIAGPLFTIMWVLEGATRPNYDLMRHPISSLAIGALGWTQTANFLVTGILILAFALGLWREFAVRGGSMWGPILIGAIGMGLVGAGIFVTDPLSGYPPGTPPMPLEASLSGRLHRAFSSLVFLGLPIACFVYARSFPRWGERTWSLYSLGTGVAFIILFILTSAGFGQVEGLVNYGGLAQRITLLVGFVWLTLLSFYMLKTISKD